MSHIDLDPQVREGALALWEALGRPKGHEHVCWALARSGVEGVADAASPTARSPMVAPFDPEAREARRMRRALAEVPDKRAAAKLLVVVSNPAVARSAPRPGRLRRA